MLPELSTKLARLAEYLDRHNLHAVLLRQRSNFSWITGGRDNYIPNNSSAGVASILAARGSITCLTNNIESVRMEKEELFGTGIGTLSYPWHNQSAAARFAHDLVGDKKIAADTDHTAIFGAAAAHFHPLSPDFDELRWSLTPEEVARYREGGRRASDAMERTCRQLKANMSEHEIAGVLDHEIRNAGCLPVVTLIASDDRIKNFRHPIPKDKKANGYVMLVTCASYTGLISNLTRFVSFAPLSDDLKRRHQAVGDVDATINLATKPGKTLGDLFNVLQQAYANCGFASEWQLHHQGGSTGYNGRDVFAMPDSHVTVRENQAFAWNPSITGTKSEDTILCTSNGIEVLTAPSMDWPQLEGRALNGTLKRADILQL